MQTTLRLDDRLYREAKARAALEGVTLTRFLEEGLELRLARKAEPGAPTFRVHRGGRSVSAATIRRVAVGEQERSDVAALRKAVRRGR